MERRLLCLVGIGIFAIFLMFVAVTPHKALAQSEPLTTTVYLPLMLSSEPPPPPPCDPPLSEMGLRLMDLPPGFVLESEGGGTDLLSAEVRALGAIDACAMVYFSFLWMLVGELGVVASQVIEFDNSTGPAQYLALVREAAVADPAVSLLPGVSLGEEIVATRAETEEGLAVYAITFRLRRFVGWVAGGGLVDLGVEVLMGYGGLVVERLP